MLKEVTSPPLANVSACLDPELGGQVFDYINGMLAETEEAWFEEHLLHCDKCYQMTVALDWVNDTLRAELEEATALEPITTPEAERSQANHPNITVMGNPVNSSSTIYFVVGGLGVVGLVALGLIGFNKLSKIKRSLLASVETAPS